MEMMYRYYATQRWPAPGAIPTGKTLVRTFDFDRREPVNGKNFAAYGYAEYSEPLTEKEVRDYELQGPFLA